MWEIFGLLSKYFWKCSSESVWTLYIYSKRRKKSYRYLCCFSPWFFHVYLWDIFLQQIKIEPISFWSLISTLNSLHITQHYKRIIDHTRGVITFKVLFTQKSFSMLLIFISNQRKNWEIRTWDRNNTKQIGQSIQNCSPLLNMKKNVCALFLVSFYFSLMKYVQ